MQIDATSPSNRHELDSFSSLPKDTRPADDGVREDTFVDCPDEIENSESQQNSEEKDNLQDDQADESDSGIKVSAMIAEIELLRDKLEKSVSEKEHLAQEYEVDHLMPFFYYYLIYQCVNFLNASPFPSFLPSAGRKSSACERTFPPSSSVEGCK